MSLQNIPGVQADRALIIKQELIKEIEKTFQDCKTLWDAKVLSDKMFGYHGTLHNLAGALQKGSALSWRGHEIVAMTQVDDLLSDIVSFSVRVQKSRTICSTFDGVRGISASEKVLLMYNDIPKAGVARAKAWLKQQEDKKLLMYFAEIPDHAAWKELNDRLGTVKAHWLKTSDLPKIARKRYVPSKTNGEVIMAEWAPDTRNYSHETQWWTDVELDPAIVDGVYVPIRRHGVVDKDGECREGPRSIKNLYNALKSIDKAPDIIYGIKYGSVKKIVKLNPDWVDFRDYAVKEYKKYFKKHKLKKILDDHSAVNDIENRQAIKDINKQLMRYYPCVKGAVINRLAEALYKAERGNSKELGLAITLRNHLPHSAMAGPGTSTVKEFYQVEEIKKRYPLLPFLINRGGYNGFYTSTDEHAKMLAHYVYMIEMENK